MPPRGLHRLIAVAGALAAAQLACPGRVARAPNALLVTVDTLRADRLTPYGATDPATPSAERLAAEGTLFEAAVSPMQITLPSHFSLFTSVYPRDHGVVNNWLFLPEDFPTLAEVLRDAGYRTAAFVGTRLLQPGTGAERGFEVYDHPRAGYERRAEQVVRPALRWLETAPEDEPFFLWVHLFDPHLPYAPPEGFAPDSQPETARALPVADWDNLLAVARRFHGDLPPEFLERAGRLYAGEVAYADHWLGELIARLAEQGRLDATLVAFTADHGECFDHGIYFEHSGCLYEGSARVPLIFRYPGSVPAGERRRDVVELLDVAPTLLALLGVPAPAGFTGRRLFAGDPPRDAAFLQHPLYSARSVANRVGRTRRLRSVAGDRAAPVIVDQEQLGLRTGEWKYLATGDREELYHLIADPGETRNLAAERPDVLARLRPALERWREAHPLRLLDDSRVNDELLETLRALGYVQ